jgi:hypothetical protein
MSNHSLHTDRAGLGILWKARSERNILLFSSLIQTLRPTGQAVRSPACCVEVTEGDEVRMTEYLR